MANQTLTIAIVAQAEQAQAELRQTKRDVNALDRAVDDVDGSRFRKDMDRNRDSTDKMGFSLSKVLRKMLTLGFLMKSMKFIGIYTGIRLLLPLLSAMSAMLFALTSSLGAFTGLIGLYPGVASAFISAFGAIKFATMGVSESLSVLMADEASPEELAKAMENASPALVQFARNLRNLQEAVKPLQKEAQGNLFDGINRGLAGLENGFLPLVIDHFVRMSDVIGDIIAGVGEMLGQRGVLQSLDTVFKGNERTVKTLGNVFTNFIEILTHVTAAAQPLVEKVMEALDRRTGNLLERVRKGVRDGTLARFFSDGFEAARRMAAFIGTVWRALKNVNDVLEENDLRNRFIKPFEEGAAAFEKYTASIEGQADILRWFERSADSMDAFYGFLGRITSILRDLGNEGEAQEALTYFLQEMSAAEGPLTRFFDGLNQLDLMGLVDTVIDVLNAVADLATLVPVFEPLITLLGQIARAVSWAAEQFAKLPDPIKQTIGWGIALKSVISGLWTVFSALAGAKILAGLKAMGSAIYYAIWSRAVDALHFMKTVFLPGLKTVFTTVAATAGRALSAIGGAFMRVLTVAKTGIIVAFRAIGTAIVAHPVIAVIVGLIALFVILWNHSETFRRVVTNAFNAVLNAARTAWEWLNENWRQITALMGPVGWAINHLVNNFDKVKAAAQAVWQWITDNWRTLLMVFAPFVAVVVTIVENFNAIKTAVIDAMATVRSQFESAVSFVRGLPGVDLLVNVVGGAVRGAESAYRTVTGVGGDSSAQRGGPTVGGGAGRGLAGTLAMHAMVDAMTPGTRTITNATKGRYGGSDHHKGRALDLTGNFMGAYSKNLAAVGGAAERHGQGSGGHHHAVFPVKAATSGGGGGGGGPSGDTMRNILPGAAGGGGGDIIIDGPLIGQVVANSDVDVESATYRALQRIVRERRERA